ncbi:MAG TPA: diguanylate cyclase [Steroidobacteraceae bacterium]|jgi:diguanylate cyclase (GGDEF)-like protein/PAS domain S-box-containing protein|nr:diguanylate cyclase [Steroidobacteraceae bacterium]
MADWSIEFLRAVLDAVPEGIVVCEARPPDHPVVYANAAFARMSGYAPAELLGQDLRCLQSWDREQESRSKLRAALAGGETCRALLRNYRKDGTQFWNEVMVQPMRPADAGGTVRYVIGFHRDVSERERPAVRRTPGPSSLQREDRLSGLCSRAYFEELLLHDWQIGARETHHSLTLLAFDIDELACYNDTFGRAAGDACIRRVCGVIGACFRRGSDVVARWDGGCVVAMIRNSHPDATTEFARTVVQKVFEQHIHNPRALRQKFVSVRAGAAHLSPSMERAPETLIQAVMRALKRAKQVNQGPVAVAEPAEIG